MPDMIMLANKRAQAIIAVSKADAFIPITHDFQSPIDADFELVPNVYFSPTDLEPLYLEVQTEFRPGMDKRFIRVMNGSVYLYSLDRPEVGVYKGAVIKVMIRFAGRYLANGTHIIATQKQIVNYMRFIQTQNATIEEKEMNRDPVAYSARKESEANAKQTIARLRKEGRIIHNKNPDEPLRAIAEPTYTQDGNDWPERDIDDDSDHPNSHNVQSARTITGTVQSTVAKLTTGKKGKSKSSSLTTSATNTSLEVSE